RHPPSPRRRLVDRGQRVPGNERLIVFTGLVEEMGRVIERDGNRLVVSADRVHEDSDLGASVAVNGACLTVVERGPGRLRFDVGPETLAPPAPGGPGDADA